MAEPILRPESVSPGPGSEAGVAESGTRQMLAAREHPEEVWAPGVLVLVAIGLIAGWVLRARWDRYMRWDGRMGW